MIRISIPAALPLAVLLLASAFAPTTRLYAQPGVPNPVVVERFTAETIDTAARTARVVLWLRARAAGVYTLGLRLTPLAQDGPATLLRGEPAAAVALDSGAALRREWTVRLPADSYQELARATITFAGSPAVAARYIPANAVGLYADIRGGRVVACSRRPDRAHTALRPSPMAPDAVLNREAVLKRERGRLAASTTITVNISGRITTEALMGRIFNGVPGVRVYFDWDQDLDDGTITAPTYSGPETAPYAVTDNNGDFTFTRQVIAPENSAIWTTPRITLSVEAANEAGYDEDLGPTAIFPEHFHQPIAISPASPTITPTAFELGVEQKMGNSLRFLLRARRFAIANFWFSPGTVQFNDDPDDSQGSHYNPIDNSIDFVTVAQSETAYHEYGHFYNYAYAGFWGVPIAGGAHQVGVISSDKVAYSEGWAEFFSAAAHAYWYALEQPTLRENEYHGHSLAQFHDAEFPTTPNTYNEESAVSRFMFNLWDDYHARATVCTPVYNGDNDDLDHDRPFGHPRPWLLYTLADAFHASHYPNFYERWFGDRDYPLMDAFRDKYLAYVNQWYPATYPYHAESIKAMFSYFRDRSVELRAATPTDLTVVGNWNARTLSWSNHFCPDDISWTTLDGNHSFVELLDNREARFVVWRKELRFVPRHPAWEMLKGDPYVFDGRLDGGYQQIGLAAAGAAQYVDNDDLATGRYAYVVVACRVANGVVASSLSIPKARAEISVARPEVRRLDDDVCHSATMPIGGKDSLVATKPGSPNATYHWYSRNKPAFITLEGVDGNRLTMTNNYVPGVGYHAGDTLLPFSVWCVVTDSSGADTSLPYYPAYTPLDSASRFVSVWNGTAFVPENAPDRGLDFVTQPGEDFISVLPVGREIAGDTIAGYRVLLTGFNTGATMYTEARLLVMAHPPGTAVAGSARCGFRVYTASGGGVVEDTTHAYGLESIPLDSAYHSRLGVVTDYVAWHDSLWVTVNPLDSLVLVFNAPSRATDSSVIGDTTYARDTTRDHWAHEFILELRGRYEPAGGAGSAAPIAAAPARQPWEHGYLLEPGCPNPARAATVIRYTLGADGPVRLTLHDARGQALQTLAEGVAQRGSHALPVDLSALPAGLYFYRLSAVGWSSTQPLTVVR